MTKKPETPANLTAYVEVLGVDGAVEFFLTFGGSELYLPQDPKGGSEITRAIGVEKTKALAARLNAMKIRVPTSKRWIAQVLNSKELPVSKIARRLHVSDVTVRKYIRGEYSQNSRQLDLFR